MTLARGDVYCMNAAPFQQVQAFVAVARHRSFSGAARELGVSRSAVSQAVRQLEEALRYVLVGAPSYFARRGTPDRPEDLLSHECITFRSHTTGALYTWELERGRRTWRVPVRGGVVTNDGLLCASLAELGLGLAYAPEPMVVEQLGEGRLKVVLERYAPVVPGYFLYFPSRARSSPPLRLFIEAARELAVRAVK